MIQQDQSYFAELSTYTCKNNCMPHSITKTEQKHDNRTSIQYDNGTGDWGTDDCVVQMTKVRMTTVRNG
jgi:hypothetical protein